jgi:hypothetical protein
MANAQLGSPYYCWYLIIAMTAITAYTLMKQSKRKNQDDSNWWSN